jgi:flagellar capping protein FliD
MQGFADDLNVVGQDFEEIWENLPDSVKNMFEATAEREAVSSGIATASQDSVDELNGRMTAVQSHTYSISENTKTLLLTTQDILRSVMNIESETDGFKARFERVETMVKSMNNTLDDIALKGIKIK